MYLWSDQIKCDYADLRLTTHLNARFNDTIATFTWVIHTRLSINCSLCVCVCVWGWWSCVKTGFFFPKFYIKKDSYDSRKMWSLQMHFNEISFRDKIICSFLLVKTTGRFGTIKCLDLIRKDRLMNLLKFCLKNQ